MSPSRIQRSFDAYLGKFNSPAYDFDINIARVLVCGFFIWKLLSRDFSTFAIVPPDALNFYPFYLYARDNIVVLMGVPGIIQLCCFHWVHWFLPFPNEAAFVIIQWTVIGLTAITLLLGRGPKRLFAISSYIGLLYLWGFVFRSGMEQDAVDMYMVALLMLIISDYKDVPLFTIGRLLNEPASVSVGRARSLLILVLIFYYFASGMNKISDIYPLGWFQYDLVEAIENFRLATKAGAYVYSPPI